MANNDLKRVGLVFEADGTTNFKKSLGDVNNALANNRNQFKLTQMQWDENTSASDKLAAKSDFLATQFDNQGVKVQALREKLEKLESSENANEKQIDNTRKQLLNAEVAYQKYGKELEDVNKELLDSKSKLKEFSKGLDDVSTKAKSAGDTLSKTLTVGIMAAGAASIAAWNEIDESYDNIIKKTGAVGDEAEALNDVFDSVYSTMPVSAELVSDAVSEVSRQFGLQGDALESATKYLIQYAEVNDTDVASAAQNAKAAIAAYNLETKDMNSVLDAVTKVSQKTGVSVDDLMTKVVDGAPQIKALGLSFGQGAALMGSFEQNGVDSSAALSSLSKASVAYAKDGKTLAQGLAETQQRIMNAKDETEALTIASEVFGTKGASRMADAIKRGTLNLDELAKTTEGTAGAVANSFNETLDPADQSVIAFNNATLALSKFGDVIQKALGPIMEKFSEWLKGVTEWFSSLDSTQQTAILTIVALVAAIGPLLVVFGSMAGGLSQIITLLTAETTANALSSVQKGVATAATWAWNAAQTALNTVMGIGHTVTVGLSAAMTFLAANPIVAVIAVIALLVAGFIYFWNTSEDFRNFFINMWSEIQKLLEMFGAWLDGIFTKDWTESFGIIGNLLNAFFANVSNIVESVKRIFSGIIDFVTGVFTGNWSQAWNGVKNIFGGIFDGLMALAKAPLNGIIGFLNVAIDAINGLIRGLNNIKFTTPSWIPFIGGKSFGFNISTIGKLNYLAKGGTLTDGMAIYAEAGPELLINQGGKSHVIPTSRGGGENHLDLAGAFSRMTELLEVIAAKDLSINKNTLTSELTPGINKGLGVSAILKGRGVND